MLSCRFRGIRCLYLLAGGVSRPIVDDDHLFQAAQTMETLEYLSNGGLLIVGWYHDRQDGPAQHAFRWSRLIVSIEAVR